MAIRKSGDNFDFPDKNKHIWKNPKPKKTKSELPPEPPLPPLAS
ncbi:MAG: hypothetical protein RM021_021155 [Nostoc sp. EkiNYC01]|nr:hypothetical protein [Nostoc sp. EkiNYC01]